ncbi:hypothetical protein [Pontibacter chitinilyticus]|uniref:hypothetical protein n=1 Tax=Pontibacter chitinilyticus TaxID=2674989 RepID=UPI003219AA7E
MKKLLIITCMLFGGAFAAQASSMTGPTETNTSKLTENRKEALVEKRAENLSDMMIRELRLNKYQSRKVRAINLDVVNKKMAVEREFAGNQNLIDQKTKEITATRDRLLEHVLSTVQYNHYFGSRNAYNQAEQDFMASNTTLEVPATASIN